MIRDDVAHVPEERGKKAALIVPDQAWTDIQPEQGEQVADDGRLRELVVASEQEVCEADVTPEAELDHGRKQWMLDAERSRRLYHAGNPDSVIRPSHEPPPACEGRGRFGARG